MRAIFSVATLLLGIAIILIGNGLLGTLLGIRGQLETFSTATLGLIMAGYFSGFVLGPFLVPGLIRRVGHIRTFAALASLAAAVTLLHGLFVFAAIWLPLRVLSGLCIVGLYIVIESWLNEQTSNEQRGHVFSAYMTTTLVGLGLGQLLLLLGDVGTLQLFAVAAVLMALGLLPVALTRVQEPPIVEPHRLGLRKLYEISPLGVIGAFFSGIGGGAFWGLGAVFAAAIGLSAAGVSGFMALSILGGTLMMWPIGRLSDRYDRRKVLTYVFLLTGLSMLLAMALMNLDLRLVLLGGFLYGATGFSIYALSAAHTNDHVDRSQMLEAASSLQLLYGLGAICGPILAGILMQVFGPGAWMVFIAISALIPAGFALHRMRVRAPVAQHEQGDWVPQFATSPIALEMHPDQEETRPDTETSPGN